MEESLYLSAASVANIQDREWMQYAAASLFPSPERELVAFLEAQIESGVAFSVHDIEARGLHVGNAYLVNINFVHRTAETSMMIFKEYRGRRYDVRTGQLLLKFGFLRLRLRRILAASINPAALATNYGMGMSLETRLRKASLVGAGIKDSTQFAISREDFMAKFERHLGVGDG